MKNVFITPHIAGSLSCENGRMVKYMVTAYFNTLKGLTDTCEVSKEKIHNQT